MEKTCSTCKAIKTAADFYFGYGEHMLQAACITCMKAKDLAFRRSKKGCINRMFYRIDDRLRRCPSYQHRRRYFNRQEFIDWVKTSNFETVYEAWRASGYILRQSPSVDRVNNNGDYTLDNIQIIPTGENVAKGCK